jgi:hypothetical protein
MAERLGNRIDVLNRQAAEIRFQDREQIFFNLQKTEFYPAVGKMVAMVKRRSRGNTAFEAGNKFSRIALDSRVGIEAQPEFGMVVFATPG